MSTAAISSSTPQPGLPAPGLALDAPLVDPSRKHLDIPSLDGLRAVSFFMVFLSHAELTQIIPGGFGVTVFFFLSGYLITTLFRVELDKTRTISLRQYYLRRALRIFPPLYIVLILAVVLTFARVLPGDLTVGAVLSQFLQVSNYYNIRFGSYNQPAGTAVFWSLAVEEHFYLIFPVAFILLCRHVKTSRSRGLVLLGVCALLLFWRCILVFHFHVDEFRTFFGTDTRIDSILFGCILALWGNPMFDPPTASDAGRKYVWLPLGLGLLAFTFLIRDGRFRETFRYTLQGVALIPLFIAAIRYPAWWPFRLLNLRPVRFVGLISYTLYLVHYTVIEGLRYRLPGWPLFVRGVLALAVALVIATAMYYAVERPCARLRRRLTA